MAARASTTARAEPRARRPFPLRTGVAQVVRVVPVTPRMTRVTLGGPALAGFPVEEPGEIVTLLWPAPGRPLVLPAAGWRFPAGVADAQHARNYTVRHWDAARGELDVDLVLHGTHGRASRWAAEVRGGDTIGFAGPRAHWTRGEGADWSLLVADETGLPALAAIAATLPAGHPTMALIEVQDAAERVPLRSPAALRTCWLHRGAAAPGTTTLLADAVRGLALPAGRGRAWGGGEARAMRDARRHLREAGGMPAGAVDLLGYWKHRSTDGWD